MRKFADTGTLTSRQHQQRIAAARASAEARHRAESNPSIRQGSSGAPSKTAIALFRQGQARPDTRARRGPWDTHATEAPIGAMNATLRIHVPKAYRGQPDRPRVSPRTKKLALRAVQDTHQDVRILNPTMLAEAHRYPQMREIIQRAVQVVRDHQKGAIERGQEDGLIPEGTRPGTVVRAYKHAALRAMHHAGLVDYDTQMDDAAKAEFTPLKRFMLYSYRRVFDHLNQGPLKGKWAPFREEFGRLHRQKKHGQYTGVERMRMRPAELIKAYGAPRLARPLRAADDVPAPRLPRVAYGMPKPPKSPHRSEGWTQDRFQPAQALSGMAGGAVGAKAAMMAAKKPAARFGHKYGKAAEAQVRLAARQSGASKDYFARKTTRLQARLARNLVGHGARGLALGIAGAAGALGGDILGDYAIRRARHWMHKAAPAEPDEYRHMTTLGMLGGAAGMLLGHKALGGKLVFRSLRRSPWKRAGADFGASVAGGALGEQLGNQIDDRTGTSRALSSVNRSLRLGKGMPIAGAAIREMVLMPAIAGATVRRSDGRYQVVLTEPALAKQDTDDGFYLADFNADPAMQLHRAMRTRMHHRPAKLRLNTQRDLRHLLNGGVTRQERWQLGIRRSRDSGLDKRAAGSKTPGESATGADSVPDSPRKAGRGGLLTESEVRQAANEAARPTPAQIEAGNYRKGHLRIGGLDISIETPKGRKRRGVDPNGRPWSVTMPAHYGYVRGSEGADGDHVDVYLGPLAREAPRHPVFVVDQHTLNGRFDEHKALLGFPDLAAAQSAYDRAFSDGRGPDRRKAVHAMSWQDFRAWLQGDTTQPIGLRKGLAAGLAGAAGAGLAARAIGRGVARGRARVAARNYYAEGLKDILREHQKVFDGGTPGPTVRAEANAAMRAAKKTRLNEAMAMRDKALAAAKAPRIAIAGSAAAGGLIGLHHRSRRPTLPPLYQSAAQSSDAQT